MSKGLNESGFQQHKENTLADSIFEIAKKYSDTILLADRFISLSGSDILHHIRQYEPVFDRFSRKRSRIGIIIPNSALAGLALLSVIASGRVPVVLNPSTARKHLEKLLPKLNLDFLIVSHFAYPKLHAPCSFIHLNLNGTTTLKESGQKARPPDLPRNETTLILYTSGSEGEPKGVQLSQTGILYTVDTLIDYFGLDASTVATCILPLFHTMGLNTQFLPTFLAGGKCVFYEPTLNLGKIYRRIIESKGTFIGLVTEFLKLCHEEKNRRNLPPAEKVRHVQIAGGLISEKHVHMAVELFPNAVIHKGYGLTEAIRVSMISSKDPKFFHDTAGCPLPGQELTIRDVKGVVLPPDTVGQIHVKGPNVMLGYDNLMNSVPIVGGFLNTGDLGYVTSNGYLTIVGRRDSLFKVKGECVSGWEIEKAARCIYSQFRDVKTLPVEVDDGVRPILFLEMNSEQIPIFIREQKERFKSALKDMLKSRTKIPRDIIVMNSFPRTCSGKIRHGALHDLCLEIDRECELPRSSRGPNFVAVSPTSENALSTDKETLFFPIKP